MMQFAYSKDCLAKMLLVTCRAGKKWLVKRWMLSKIMRVDREG